MPKNKLNDGQTTIDELIQFLQNEKEKNGNMRVEFKTYNRMVEQLEYSEDSGALVIHITENLYDPSEMLGDDSDLESDY